MIYTNNFFNLIDGSRDLVTAIGNGYSSVNSEPLSKLYYIPVESINYNGDGTSVTRYINQSEATSILKTTLNITNGERTRSLYVATTRSGGNWYPYFGNISSYNTGIAFGSSSTPPTPSDNDIEIVNGSNVSIDRTNFFSIDDGVYRRISKLLITNNKGTPFSFREMGIVYSISSIKSSDTYCGAVASTSASISILFARHVFDEEIIIPSGGVKQVSIVFEHELDGNYADIPQTTTYNSY